MFRHKLWTCSDNGTLLDGALERRLSNGRSVKRVKGKSLSYLASLIRNRQVQFLNLSVLLLAPSLAPLVPVLVLGVLAL